MKKILNVMFRECSAGVNKGEVDCVFLDEWTFEKNYRLACYARIGQHSSGCISYFYHCTKPTKNYDELLKEIQSIYSEYEIKVHKRMPNYSGIISKLREVA